MMTKLATVIIALMILVVLCDGAKKRRVRYAKKTLKAASQSAAKVPAQAAKGQNYGGSKTPKKEPHKSQTEDSAQPPQLQQSLEIGPVLPKAEVSPIQIPLPAIIANSNNDEQKSQSGNPWFQLPWGRTVIEPGDSKDEMTTSNEDGLTIEDAWNKVDLAKEEFKELVGFSGQRWDTYWKQLEDPKELEILLETWKLSMMEFEDKIGLMKTEFTDEYSFTDDAWDAYWKDNANKLKNLKDIDKLVDQWILKEEVKMVKKQFKSQYLFTDESWDGLWDRITDFADISTYSAKWEKMMKAQDTENRSSTATGKQDKPYKSTSENNKNRNTTRSCASSYPDVKKLSETLQLIESVQNILGDKLAKRIICNNGIPMIGRLRLTLASNLNQSVGSSTNQGQAEGLSKGQPGEFSKDQRYLLGGFGQDQSGGSSESQPVQEDESSEIEADQFDENEEMRQFVEEIILVICEVPLTAG